MADYAESIVAFFVARRGRGASLSATDQALLSDWEAAGLPVDVVVLGVGRAFDALRQPPRSLSECRRWVTAAAKAHAQQNEAPAANAETHTPSAEPAPLAPDEATTVVVIPAPGAVESDPVLTVLKRLCVTADDARVVQALQELAEDVRALLEDGPLTSEVLAVLDQTLVEGFLALLPTREQERASVEIDAAVAADPRTVGASPATALQLAELHRAAWVRARYALPIVDVTATPP